MLGMRNGMAWVLHQLQTTLFMRVIACRGLAVGSAIALDTSLLDVNHRQIRNVGKNACI